MIRRLQVVTIRGRDPYTALDWSGLSQAMIESARNQALALSRFPVGGGAVRLADEAVRLAKATGNALDARFPVATGDALAVLNPGCLCGRGEWCERCMSQPPEPPRAQPPEPTTWRYARRPAPRVAGPLAFAEPEPPEPFEHRLDWIREPDAPATVPEVQPVYRIEPEVQGRDLTADEQRARAWRAWQGLGYRGGFGSFEVPISDRDILHLDGDFDFHERLQIMRRQLSGELARALDRAIIGIASSVTKGR